MLDKKGVTFPIKLDNSFNKELEKAVLILKNSGIQRITKKQFILDAIREKIERIEVSQSKGENNNGI